jgi:hypothetical protein
VSFAKITRKGNRSSCLSTFTHIINQGSRWGSCLGTMVWIILAQYVRHLMRIWGSYCRILIIWYRKLPCLLYRSRKNRRISSPGLISETCLSNRRSGMKKMKWFIELKTRRELKISSIYILRTQDWSSGRWHPIPSYSKQL